MSYRNRGTVARIHKKKVIIIIKKIVEIDLKNKNLVKILNKIIQPYS